MKTEKLSLKALKNVLSRAELKKIMAGSGSGSCICGDYATICCNCYTSGPVAYYVKACTGGLQECSTLCEQAGYGGAYSQVSCNFCAGI
jgi:hypothetical protein